MVVAADACPDLVSFDGAAAELDLAAAALALVEAVPLLAAGWAALGSVYP